MLTAPRAGGLTFEGWLCRPHSPQVYAVCGDDYRLYATPLIKFQKACVQLVAGTRYRLAGERQRDAHIHARRAAVCACPLIAAEVLAHSWVGPPWPPAATWSAVRIGYPCFGTPRRVNGKVVG